MRSAKGHIGLRIISMFMLIMVLTTIFNEIVYIHAHKLADGTIVCHAHPYNTNDDSAPFKSHQHSRKEIVFLSSIHFTFINVSIWVVSIILIAKTIRFEDVKRATCMCSTILIKGRAPPINHYC